jgi:hypothetical protein
MKGVKRVSISFSLDRGQCDFIAPLRAIAPVVQLSVAVARTDYGS